MADARLLVLSLAAAFLALGLGVVIGATYAGGALERGQQAVLERLEDDFAAMRAELGTLRQRAARGDALVEGLARLAVAGRLTDVPVRVLAPAGAAGEADRLAEVLAEAGARPVRADLATLPAPAGEGLPLPAGSPSAAVVLVWPGLEPEPPGLAQLVRALRDAGRRVVVYEPAGAPHPLGHRWRRLRVPAVSGLDAPAAHAAVVWLLAGGEGVYGPFRGADGLLPRPPLPAGIPASR